MSTDDLHTRPLRRALTGNAAFSAASGLTLLLVGGALAEPLGVPALALRIVGVSLLPFAYSLLRNARRDDLNRAEAWLAVGLDLSWVLASAILIMGELWPLTTTGRWAVTGVAVVVLLFATLQTWGLRRWTELQTTRAE